MNLCILQNSKIIALLGLAIAGPTAAQEMQRVSYKLTAENIKYTQQQFIDVGDVPDHQVRSFEIHRTFSADPPLINGIRSRNNGPEAFPI